MTEKFWNEGPKYFQKYDHWLYDNSDQRQIRTENQIRIKEKFWPKFWTSAQIISLINLIT